MKTILRRLYNALPFKLPYLVALYLHIEKKIRLLNKNKVVIKKVSGIKYELHLNQLIDSSIYYDGCFEKDTTNAIGKIVKPGMNVFDIGANIGCHLLPMAKMVGKDGHVTAFEPMEWAMKKLKRNVELNDFRNITIENIGLSDLEENKEVTFRTSWTLDKSILPDANHTNHVHFTTIDNYVNSHGVKNIDFIKLDVDGYEFKILSGARNSINNFKPIILMELGDYTLKSVGNSIDDVVGFFASLGYEFYEEKSFSLLKTKEEILKSIPDLNNTTINVIVCHPTKVNKIK